ncbi:MAG: phosphoribosylamine--glycine ligase [Pyrinomonadaceae bacterium]
MAKNLNILVIGSGGREHALVWALSKTQAKGINLFCAPGNAGIAEIAECVPLSANEIPALARFAEEKSIDLTFVGGESPLAAGIVDDFEARGLMIIGPRRDAARLESSKGFAKDFMTRHQIPTAAYRVSGSAAEAKAVLNSGEFGAESSAVVVKADGLAAGKGVVVAFSRAEAEKAIDDSMLGNTVGSDAARLVVIEEALTGPEVSLLLFSDGRDFVLMPPARDHKRIGENDTGPNTGGMGAITDQSVIGADMLERIVTEVVEPTLEGAISEGFAFRGVLFIGLMLTDDGPRVLEYNVRFGDPEAQAILVRLQSPLIEILEAIGRRQLSSVKPQWSAGSSACVVLAAPGYPEHPETGALIEGLERAAAREYVQTFHAGTSRTASGNWVTAGGRVLGITSAGDTLAQALSRCYEAAGDVHWDGIQYRRDIGKQ